MMHEIAAVTSVQRGFIALGIVLAGGLLVTILARYSPLIHWLGRRVAARDEPSFSAFVLSQIRGTLLPTLYFVVCYAGLSTLRLDRAQRHLVNIFGGAILAFALARFLAGFFSYALEGYARRRQEAEGREQSLRAVIPFIRTTLWFIALLLFLDASGFHVTTLVAGLGIGTAAVAFASQQILKDVIGYGAIVTDRPFELGDTITVDAFTGSVEYIGMRTTRVRSLSGEQLIFANSDITSARIHNWARMQRRRVAFSFRIAYRTPNEKIEQIPGIVRTAVETTPDTQWGRAQWLAFEPSGLAFEVVYYVLSADYDYYVELQYRINLKIKEGIESLDVEFADAAIGTVRVVGATSAGT